MSIYLIVCAFIVESTPLPLPYTVATNKQTKNRQECQQLNEQSRRSFLIFTDFFFSFSLFLNRFFFWGGVSMELIVFTFN